MDKVNFFDINLIGTGIKSFAMLALVLACVIFVLYIMRRFLSIGAGTKGEVDMKRLGALYFSPKERIEVVEISDINKLEICNALNAELLCNFFKKGSCLKLIT